jgi:hypothetical protein
MRTGGINPSHHSLLAELIVAATLIFGPLSLQGAAATYYVDPAGNDASSGTIAQPFRAVAKGVSVLSPGDTLYIRGGTYAEGDNAVHAHSGTAGNPITIAAYPGEAVTLAPCMIVFDGVAYITLDGFVIDATNGSGEGLWLGDGSNHIIVRNIEIKNARSRGLFMGPPYPVSPTPLYTYNQVLNVKIHDNGGSDGINPVYVETSGNLFDGLEVYHSCGTVGFYDVSEPVSVDGNIIRNSYIHDTSGSWAYNHRPQCAQFYGDYRKGQGLIIVGSGNQVYNNILANIDTSLNSCGLGCGGLILFNSGSNNLVYNNTIYNITGGDAIQIGQPYKNTALRNNIIANSSVFINDLSPSTTKSNNLCTSSGTGCNIVADPLFIDIKNADYHLQPTSPAIAAGANLSSVFTTDRDGVTRPTSPAAWGVGAYEYVVTSKITAPTNLRITPK